jgi:hypothetical protein
LLGTQCAKSSKELVVDCTCVVEESANDALNSLDAFCGDRRAVGFHTGELGGLAKDDFTDACEERVYAWWALDACTWCRH